MDEKKIVVVMTNERDEEVDAKAAPLRMVLSPEERVSIWDASGLPLEILEEYDVNEDALLDYEVMGFVVALGKGKFARGFYPYYASSDFMEVENYGRFYFGGLLLKLKGDWYLADFVDPSDNPYELVEFTRMENFDAAFRASLEMAIKDYRKKTA